MSDPRPLLHGSIDDHERRLLRSAREDEPSTHLEQRLLVTLGVGSGVGMATSAASAGGALAAAAAHTTGAVAAGASATATGAGAIGAASLVKWLALGLVLGGGLSGSSRDRAERAAACSAERHRRSAASAPADQARRDAGEHAAARRRAGSIAARARTSRRRAGRSRVRTERDAGHCGGGGFHRTGEGAPRNGRSRWRARCARRPRRTLRQRRACPRIGAGPDRSAPGAC